MSISNILKDGKLVEGVLPNPYPFPATAGLGAVLQVNNSAATPFGSIPQSATNFDTLGCLKIETGVVGQGNNLALQIGEAGDNLQIKGATLLGSLLVGNGVNTETLPVGANGLVLKANSGSLTGLGVEWAVDGTSGITGVSAGNNITIDNTNPLVPIVNLQDPITSTFNFAAVALDGASNDGVVDLSQTIHIQTTGGTLAEIKESFNEVSTTRNGFTTLNQTAIVGGLEIEYIDGGINTTSSSKVQAQANQSGCRFNTINSTSGDNTLREISILDGAMLDYTTGNNATSSSTLARNIFVGGLSNNDLATLNITGGSASNAYQQLLTNSSSNLLLTTSDSVSPYTTSAALTSVKNSEATCQLSTTDTANNVVAFNNARVEAGLFTAKQEIKVVDTSALPFTSDLDLISDSTSCRIQQTYINNAGLSQFSTITTNTSGLEILSNNGALNLAAATTATLQAPTSATLQSGSSAVSATATAITNSAAQILNNSTTAGAIANPSFIFRETNATATAFPTIKTEKLSVVPIAGNPISAITNWAADSAGTQREWSRIQTKVENITPGNQDSTISFFTSVNGAVSEVFNLNGAQNENNSFRPLDMNGNGIINTSGSLSVGCSTSSTAGATLTLATKDNVAGSGAGLILSGNTLITAVAGVASANYLTLTINSVVYKIALQT